MTKGQFFCGKAFDEPKDQSISGIDIYCGVLAGGSASFAAYRTGDGTDFLPPQGAGSNTAANRRSTGTEYSDGFWNDFMASRFHYDAPLLYLEHLRSRPFIQLSLPPSACRLWCLESGCCQQGAAEAC